MSKGQIQLPYEWKSRNTSVFPIKSVPLSEKKAKVQLLQRYPTAVVFVTYKETKELSSFVTSHGNEEVCK